MSWNVEQHKSVNRETACTFLTTARLVGLQYAACGLAFTHDVQVVIEMNSYSKGIHMFLRAD